MDKPHLNGQTPIEVLLSAAAADPGVLCDAVEALADRPGDRVGFSSRGDIVMSRETLAAIVRALQKIDMQVAAGADDNLIYLTVCPEPLRAVRNHRRVYAVRFSKLHALEVMEAQIMEDRPNS